MPRSKRSTPAVFERDHLPQIEEHLLRSRNMLSCATDLVGRTPLAERRAASSVMQIATSEYLAALTLIKRMSNERLD